MTAREFFERAADLERARMPFALATVVKRYAPVSSHLGDRAIVLADGRMQGFVGGSCSRHIVRDEALDAIRKGEARLVHVEGECASEGAVDVYLEPHLPPRMLLIVGNTPVAAELARLAALLEGYHVVRVVEPAELHELGEGEEEHAVALDALDDFLGGMNADDRGRLVAVVASQGHYDEAALVAILKRGEPAYAGLLASRRRATEVFADVHAKGIARKRLANVHNPAGIDIGARRPGEVAISILAEIVATIAAHDRETKAAT
ncbi:MAG TPA: XdhC family protein [Candidatus Cybelea sp.]|jgi:xanthine dehydrogenase accessory factor